MSIKLTNKQGEVLNAKELFYVDENGKEITVEKAIKENTGQTVLFVKGYMPINAEPWYAYRSDGIKVKVPLDESTYVIDLKDYPWVPNIERVTSIRDSGDADGIKFDYNKEEKQITFQISDDALLPGSDVTLLLHHASDHQPYVYLNGKGELKYYNGPLLRVAQLPPKEQVQYIVLSRRLSPRIKNTEIPGFGLVSLEWEYAAKHKPKRNKHNLLPRKKWKKYKEMSGFKRTYLHRVRAVSNQIKGEWIYLLNITHRKDSSLRDVFRALK